MNTKNKIKSIYIVEPIHLGWIIEKLMRDVAVWLEANGVTVHIGPKEKYNSEEVAFHSRYLYAVPIQQATINSVFVTHVDDRSKELELTSLFKKFESFVCVSAQEKEFLVELGCPATQVAGIDLPHRQGCLSPTKIGIFSGCYADGRKNEAWLLEYYRNHRPAAKKHLVLCLLGYDWEHFCENLARGGVSYELYRYDRTFPNEYDLQKHILRDMDYLVYPGFDGGAMCIYDGIQAGNKLVIADNSYHRDLGIDAKLFKNKQEFFARLDDIVDFCEAREMTWNRRSIDHYGMSLLSHWETLLSPHDHHAPVSSSGTSVGIEFRRANYKSLTLRRILSCIYRSFRRAVRK